MAESLETRLYRWQAKIAALQGWRRRVVAFILGLLAVGALPPLHLIPILIPAFVGLIWLIDGSTPVHHKRRWRFLLWRDSGAWSAYRTGWWFGLGFFAAGLYWISLSFLVDAAQYG